MLTSIEIENFKSVGERVKVDIAPITLLYGENSCGKSTILQAIQLLDEILNRDNPDADKTRLGGNYIRLGGFSKFVNGRQMNKRLHVRAVFSHDEHELTRCDLSETLEELRLFSDSWDNDDDEYGFLKSLFDDYIGYWIAYRVTDYGGLKVPPEGRFIGPLYFLGPMKSFSVEVIVRGKHDAVSESAVEIESIAVQLDDQELATVEFDGDSLLHVRVNLGHPSIPDYVVNTREWRQACHEIDMKSVLEDFDDISESVQKESTEAIEVIWKRLVQDAQQNIGAGWLTRCREFANEETGYIELPVRVEPDHVLRATSPFCGDYQWAGEDETFRVLQQGLSDADLRRLVCFARIATNAIIQASAKMLDQSLFVGPLREHYEEPRTKVEADRERGWEQGLGAWDHLARGDDKLLARVNGWMTRKNRFGFSSRVTRFRDMLHELLTGGFEGAVPEPLANDVIELVNRNSVITSMILEDVESGVDLSTRDVGVGFSQLLPVVVSALRTHEGLVCLEQPELHIHARLQAVLADLFGETITDISREVGRKQFLIETHSEYLLLRLMRRIRETVKELPNDGPRLTCEDVVVNHVFRQGGQTRVRRLELDRYGNLVSEWPDSLLEIGFWEKFGE